PFILVTGNLSEEMAADSIKNGAWDYVLKENLIRLTPAIKNAFKLKIEKDKNKQAEKAIRESQAFNESLLQTSPDIIYIYDIIERKNVYSNDGIMRVLGYTVKEIQAFGENLISKLMHPDDFVVYQNEILPRYQTAKDGELIEHQYRMKYKNGDWRWLHTKESIFKRMDNGVPVQIFGITANITERKETENALKLSEKKFKELFNKSSDALLIIKNNIFIDCNIATCKMLGYATKNEFLSVHPSKLSPRIQPDGKNSFKKADEMIRLAYKKGSNKFEWIHTKKNGDDFPVEVLLTTIHNEPNNKVIYCVWRDITERKKAELIIKESEHSLLEAQKIAKIGNFNLYLKTQIAETSVNFNKIVGIDLDCELTFALWRTITHPEDTSTNQKVLEKCIRTGEKFDLEYRILTKNTQELKWIHGLGEVIYKNGEPTHFFGTIQDITQQKRAQFDLENAYSQVEQLKNQLEMENVSLKEEIALSFSYEDMIYSSQEISDVLTQVEQVSSTDATVLILGETGTGKELIAKAVHNTSNRKNKPLIRVNCAAIPAELIESELFGHIKGSFTGAINNRIGKFELADGGTLFLDEIGDLQLALQPKLLRAIQEGEIEPIGSSENRKLDVRIIVATNKNLQKEVKEKRFREDLYFRLNVFPINIPPLRERIEDIPVLIDHFVSKYCKKHRKKIKYISELTLQLMKSYAWPGNVRELENLIERSVIISNQELLIIKEFETSAKKKDIKHSNNALEEVQRNHILKILNVTQWKIDGKEGAAVLLDLKPSTLRDRMKKFGIIRPKS
ncbi:sigma 54-interacting transcriptional regulator, partial [Flavobacteriaceae bacterium AH-315-B10]|nr:sigma 54-interacting transcriptional regulator [Flavobacteriaceae bacterium AH-315-B10]